MVEHLVCNQAVVGSNPVASTRGSPGDETQPSDRPCVRGPTCGKRGTDKPALGWTCSGGSGELIENKVNWKRGINHEYDKSVVKLQSVYGGCLGVQGR